MNASRERTRPKKSTKRHPGFTKKKRIEKLLIVENLFPGDGYRVRATCRRNCKEYEIDLTSLEFVRPLPKGYPWVEAYEAWLQRM